MPFLSSIKSTRATGYRARVGDLTASRPSPDTQRRDSHGQSTMDQAQAQRHGSVPAYSTSAPQTRSSYHRTHTATVTELGADATDPPSYTDSTTSSSSSSTTSPSSTDSPRIRIRDYFGGTIDYEPSTEEAAYHSAQQAKQEKRDRKQREKEAAKQERERARSEKQKMREGEVSEVTRSGKGQGKSGSRMPMSEEERERLRVREMVRWGMDGNAGRFSC